MLGMIQVSRKVPFDNPDVLMGCRVGYLVSNVLIAAIYVYIQAKINSKKGASRAREVAQSAVDTQLTDIPPQT